MGKDKPISLLPWLFALFLLLLYHGFNYQYQGLL
jgi:hypothetical protein